MNGSFVALNATLSSNNTQDGELLLKRPKASVPLTIGDLHPDQVVSDIINHFYSQYVLQGELKESDFLDLLYITIGLENLTKITLRQTTGD